MLHYKSYLDQLLGIGAQQWPLYFYACHLLSTTVFLSICFLTTDCDLTLGPRYTKPGLQAEKKRIHHKYKKNIATTHCLQAGYSITRQSDIAIFFLYLWWARLNISWALGYLFMSIMYDELSLRILYQIEIWILIQIEAITHVLI